MARIGILTHAPRSTHTVYQLILRLYQFNTNGAIEPHTLVDDPCHGTPDTVIRVNQAIYQHANLKWFDSASHAQLSSIALPDELNHDIHNIVRQITSNTLFVDPRFCYTWPAWQHITAQTNDEVFFVLPYHHPHDNVALLHYADGLPRILGYLLWASYMLAAERFSRDYPRFWIDHALLQQDWHAACQPLLSYLQPDAPHDATTVIDEYMHAYTQHTIPQPDVSPDESSSSAYTFALQVYAAINNHASAAEFDQLQHTLEHEIIPTIDHHLYTRFAHVYTHNTLASTAYIALLQDSHTQELRAVHDDYRAQLDELYEHLNQNAAAIHEQLTKRIHELHDLHEQKLKELGNPAEQRSKELIAKNAQLTQTVQLRTQRIQDLKHALEQQKESFAHHINTISNDISSERTYYQQTIDNLTAQITWQQDVIAQQQTQLHHVRFFLPVMTVLQRLFARIRPSK
jgi:hypothetical protein